jgi:hypothetical protein
MKVLEWQPLPSFWGLFMFRLFLMCLFCGAVAILTTGCSGSTSVLPGKSASVAYVTPTPSAVPNATANPALVALNDDFSEDALGGPAKNWQVNSGTWLICRVGSVQAYCQTSLTAGKSFDGATSWTDYTVDGLVTSPNVAVGEVGIMGRAAAVDEFYLLDLRSQINGSTPYWYIMKDVSGTFTPLAGGPLQAPDINPHYNLRLGFAGNSITASIGFDGGTSYRALGTITDSSYAAGQVGVRTLGTGVDSLSNILVTLAAVPLSNELAVSSDTFVNSMGMNAHVEAANYSNYTLVRSLIQNLGIRHYRFSAALTLSQASYRTILIDLYNSFGVTFDVLADLHTTPAQVLQALSLLPVGSVNSVEGPNEADNPGQGMYYDANFAVDVPAYMRSLYPAVKSNLATSQVTVIGPSFINSTSYAAIGNISSDVDAGNMHDYFSGFSPGTQGWGGNGFAFAPTLNYGSIAWNMASSAQATGSKPIVATETGYYTAPIHGGVPLDVQAKYVPRLYLEQYLNHVPRTFMYQLIGYDTTTGDGSLDIVNPSYAPSPAYNALAGMIAMLSDGGTNGASVNYNWALTGQVTNVAHLLLHKANGTFILPLWIEVPSFDPNANGGVGAEIMVPQQTITVNIGWTANSGVLWTCKPATGAWSSQTVAIANGSVTIPVGDTVSVLEISPS